MSQKALISAQQLYKTFGEQKVLAGTTIELFPGKIVGLIGESGAGKSVLCKCITGLESFESGEVHVAGRVLGPGLDIFDQRWVSVRKVVGMVPQETALPPYRTAMELIGEGPQVTEGLSQTDALKKASRWIELFGLGNLLDKYLHELSGGEVLRIKLARALATQPQFLICDEITANVDPLLIGDIGEELLTLVREGIGLLVVSHQIEFLRNHASQVHFLSKGKITYSGTADKILTHVEADEVRRFIAGVRRAH